MIDANEPDLPWRERRGPCGIAEYDGNQFIRVLPPPPSSEECFEFLRSDPPVNEAERLLAPHLREQLAFIRVKQAFIPVTTQLRQAQLIDLLIRNGYAARNPSLGRYQAGMTALARARTADAGPKASKRKAGGTADSMVVLGPSGIGKTTLLWRMLEAYPQVIQHCDERLGIVTQIVWIRVEAPADGSPRQLVLSMFHEIDKLLGTDYVQRLGSLPREQLLLKAQETCALHAIGLVAVDEIQNLANSKAGPEDLMSFLTSLVNVVDVPILMIGTMAAVDMMTSGFRTARRGEGIGSIVYEPMKNDSEWKEFVKRIFRYQWTTTPTDPTPELADVLWDESQGIIDIALKLFVLSQMRAIRLGARGRSEAITAGLIRVVAKESLRLVRPMLDALRRKDWKALARYEDLGGLDAFLAAELEKAWPGAASGVDLAEMTTSLAAKIDAPDGEVARAGLVAALVARGMDPKQVGMMLEMADRVLGGAGGSAGLEGANGRKSKEETDPEPMGGGRGRRGARAVENAAAPVDPNDLRAFAAGADPLAALTAAGMVEAA